MQPLPPADILAAGAALFAAGGQLRERDAGIGIGPGVGGALGANSLGLQSYYAPWILADLAHWSHTGISQVQNIANNKDRIVKRLGAGDPSGPGALVPHQHLPGAITVCTRNQSSVVKRVA